MNKKNFIDRLVKSIEMINEDYDYMDDFDVSEEVDFVATLNVHQMINDLFSEVGNPGSFLDVLTNHVLKLYSERGFNTMEIKNGSVSFESFCSWKDLKDWEDNVGIPDKVVEYFLEPFLEPFEDEITYLYVGENAPDEEWMNYYEVQRFSPRNGKIDATNLINRIRMAIEDNEHASVDNIYLDYEDLDDFAQNSAFYAVDDRITRNQAADSYFHR